MMSKYKNVVFDVGNVLMKFCPREYLHTFYSEEETERLIGEVFHQPEFREYEKGIHTSDELSELYGERFPKDRKKIRDIIDHWADLSCKIEESWRLLQTVKKYGYNTFILSTMGREWKEAWLAKYPEFEIVDGSVFSYEVKANKPEPEIYDWLFQRYFIEPADSLFLDDNEKNIEQGKKMGMNGIVFSAEEQTYHRIAEELEIEKIWI